MLALDPPILTFTPDVLGARTTVATALGPNPFQVNGLMVEARELWEPTADEREILDVAMDHVESKYMLQLRRFQYESPGTDADGGEANWVRVLRAIPMPWGANNLQLDDERALWMRSFATIKRDAKLAEFVAALNIPPSSTTWQHFSKVRAAYRSVVTSLRVGNTQAFTDVRLPMVAYAIAREAVPPLLHGAPPPLRPPPIPIGQQLVVDITTAPAAEVGRAAYALKLSINGRYQ